MSKRIRLALRLATLVAFSVALSAGYSVVTMIAQQPAATRIEAESAEVKLGNFSFAPATLTVPAGTTVTWTNGDDTPHTVVGTDGAFKSNVLDSGEKFSYTFSKAGSFRYSCSIHPKMAGKVVVQ